jgi:HEAT repeat protein
LQRTPGADRQLCWPMRLCFNSGPPSTSGWSAIVLRCSACSEHFSESRDRRYAVETLTDIGPAEPEVVSALINVLERQHEDARASAAEVLGRIRPPTAPIIQALFSALRDECPLVRKPVVEALGRIGSASAGLTVTSVVRLLTAALRDQDASVRRTVVESLGRIGPAATAATSAIEEADRDDEDPVVRGMIRVALLRIRRNE